MVKEFGIKLGAVIFAAFMFAGCAQMNSATAWLASPQTKAAFQTLEVGAQVFVCDIAGIANLGSQIEAAVNAKQAVLTTTGQVATVSALVCNQLTGIATSATITAVGTSANGSPVIAVK